MFDRRAADAKYRKKHRKKINLRIKKWKKDHPKRTKKSAKKYRLKHKRDITLKNSEYRKRKTRERKEYNAKYYKAHKRDYKRRLNKWRKENPERASAQIHKRRALRTQAGGQYTDSEWQALKREAKNKCLKCGKRRKLVPDHVLPIAKGGSSNIGNIQPLCQPCNSQKSTSNTDYRATHKGLREIKLGVPFCLERASTLRPIGTRLRSDSENEIQRIIESVARRVERVLERARPRIVEAHRYP